MLTEKLIESYGEQFVGLFQQLEYDTITDISRRVRKSDRWTETAELQAKALSDMGYSTARLRTEVIKNLHADKNYIKWIDQNTVEAKRVQQKAINKAVSDLKKTAPKFWAEVGNMSFNDDLSMWKQAGQELPTGSNLPKLLKVLSRRSTSELLDLTRSLAFKFDGANVRLSNAFRHIMNSTIVSVATGVKSPQQAIQEAVWKMCDSGLRSIDYASGRSYQLDTAARLVTRSSCSKIAGDISILNIKETGVELVEVSSHWGARPEHEEWQGKIYKYN